MTHDEREQGGWPSLSDALLRGVVHAMNNRITSMSAVAELADMDGEQLAPGAVRDDLARLTALIRMIGALSAHGGEPEALELAPLLEEVLRLHVHHPRLRTVVCQVEREAGLLPVRARRWAMLRLLLLLVDGAKQSAPDGASEVVLRLTGDAAALRVSTEWRVPIDDELPMLAAQCGGTLHRDGDTITLELPSLLEVRRRERAAPPA